MRPQRLRPLVGVDRLVVALALLRRPALGEREERVVGVPPRQRGKLLEALGAVRLLVDAQRRVERRLVLARQQRQLIERPRRHGARDEQRDQRDERGALALLQVAPHQRQREGSRDGKAEPERPRQQHRGPRPRRGAGAGQAAGEELAVDVLQAMAVAPAQEQRDRNRRQVERAQQVEQAEREEVVLDAELRAGEADDAADLHQALRRVAAEEVPGEREARGQELGIQLLGAAPQAHRGLVVAMRLCVVAEPVDDHRGVRQRGQVSGLLPREPARDVGRVGRRHDHRGAGRQRRRPGVGSGGRGGRGNVRSAAGGRGRDGLPGSDEEQGAGKRAQERPDHSANVRFHRGFSLTGFAACR